MLKLVHNLQCCSNFTKRVLLLDSSRQNSPKRRCFTKIGDYWRLLSTNKSKFCRLAMPPRKRQSYHFYEAYQSVHIHCNAKKPHVHSCYTFRVTCPIATSDARLCNRTDHIHEPKIATQWTHLHPDYRQGPKTNVFQINLCKLLFRATLKVWLGSCLSTALIMDNLDCTKINAHFKKFTACLREGIIHDYQHTLLAPPFSLMSVNNSLLCSTHSHC